MQRDQVFPFLVERQPPVIDTTHQVILYVEGLSVSFDGFRALNNLNLYVDDGELRCLIGANALVTEGMEVPDGSMVLGSPGKIKKTFTEEERSVLAINAEHYVANGKHFAKKLKEQP